MAMLNNQMVFGQNVGIYNLPSGKRLQKTDGKITMFNRLINALKVQFSIANCESLPKGISILIPLSTTIHPLSATIDGN